MHISPDIGSVVGQTSQTHWGQVFLTPHAYGVVEIEEALGGAMKLGVSVLAKLTEKLRQPPARLQELTAIASSIEGRYIQTILLLVPVGRLVYLVLRGSGRVYCKRNDQLSRLMDKEGSLSGQVKPGDTLLLASQSFIQTLQENELVSVFDHGNAQEVAEKLTLLLHTKADGTGGAALIFQIRTLITNEVSEEIERARSIAQPGSAMAEVREHVRFEKVKQMIPFKHVIRKFRHRTDKKSLGAIISIAFIIFFAISVILGIQKQRSAYRNQEVTNRISDAQHAFEEGIALMELNPVKGRERLSQAKELLAPLTQTFSPKTKEGRDALALYAQVSDQLTSARRSTTQEPILFYELGLLKKDARARSIANRGSTMTFLDTSGRGIYTLSLTAKNGQVVGGGEVFSGASLLATHGEKVYILVPTGIHEIGLRDKKVAPLVIRKSSEWGMISSIVSFGGNLYLLDTQKSRIWKYIATDKATPAGGQGFSDLREYLNPDTILDLTQATGMAIDGSVWIGTTDGKIVRFTQGKENTFFAQGVEPDLGKDLTVYTSDETKNVYILDRQNKRIVVLDKDGLYQAQYSWTGDMFPTQFIVSEELRKILLLIDGKLYSMELK
ncbi:hypothetical protein HY409_01655 [Candidatus Gottesmanbacteria bacterium]|nr:hypothetical protein [Candidatus Gottesmanbacteria bacterium]